MFTGLVQDLGVVKSRSGPTLIVKGRIGKQKRGASIAVNGVCLTALAASTATHRFDVGPETYARTNLGALRPGSPVNLERSLRAADPIGGHWVSGHVDSVGKVLKKVPWEKDFIRLRVSLPSDIHRLVAVKGSIAVDGTSLTVTAVGRGWFEVMLIPETLQKTTLGRARVDSRVNLEADLLARYVDNILAGRKR